MKNYKARKNIDIIIGKQKLFYKIEYIKIIKYYIS